MTKNFDAIIIGAGIIGAVIGYELSEKGLNTLNVEMLSAAGYGSTSNSCAIIMHTIQRWTAAQWPTTVIITGESGRTIWRPQKKNSWRSFTNVELRS